MATTTSLECPKYVQFRLHIYWAQFCLPKSNLRENEEKWSFSCNRTEHRNLPSKSPYRYDSNPIVEIIAIYFTPRMLEKKHENKASAREHKNI